MGMINGIPNFRKRTPRIKQFLSYNRHCDVASMIILFLFFFSSSSFYNRFKYRYRRENTIEREERWKGKYFSSLNFALALLLHRREDDRRGKIGKKSDGLIEWSRLMNIVF